MGRALYVGLAGSTGRPGQTNLLTESCTTHSSAYPTESEGKRSCGNGVCQMLGLAGCMVRQV